MNKDEFEPLPGIEHTKTCVFIFIMNWRIMNFGHKIINAFAAFDQHITCVFLGDFHHRRFSGYSFGNLHPERREPVKSKNKKPYRGAAF
jgi:hypothetical protein